MIIEDVTKYIEKNIINSSSFDKLAPDKQAVAIRNAESILYLYFKAYNPEKKQLPIEAIVYQTMWEIDKIGVRDSDLGVASQSVEGMTQTFRGMDRTVAPEVRKILRNRVGRYHMPVSDTNRHMIV